MCSAFHKSLSLHLKDYFTSITSKVKLLDYHWLCFHSRTFRFISFGTSSPQVVWYSLNSYHWQQPLSSTNSDLALLNWTFSDRMGTFSLSLRTNRCMFCRKCAHKEREWEDCCWEARRVQSRWDTCLTWPSHKVILQPLTGSCFSICFSSKVALVANTFVQAYQSFEQTSVVQLPVDSLLDATIPIMGCSTMLIGCWRPRFFAENYSTKDSPSLPSN